MESVYVTALRLQDTLIGNIGEIVEDADIMATVIMAMNPARGHGNIKDHPKHLMDAAVPSNIEISSLTKDLI
ncbi:hypothetical protein JXL19_08005 [bacterium]|nr:hypothetical protein [bacterium]